MITVISRENCKYCNMTKNVLREMGLTYTEKKIGVDITRDEVLAEYPSQRTLPIIIVNEVVIGGYEDMVLEIQRVGHGNFGRMMLNE